MTTGGFGISWILLTDGTPEMGLPVAVAGVKDLKFPEQANVLADVTTHDADSGAALFAGTGLKAATTFEATLVWDSDDESHERLVAFEASGAAIPMTLLDSGGDEALNMDGIVKSLRRESEQDNVLLMKAVVQVTGPIAITYPD
jgi:hypothetical protein